MGESQQVMGHCIQDPVKVNHCCSSPSPAIHYQGHPPLLALRGHSSTTNFTTTTILILLLLFLSTKMATSEDRKVDSMPKLNTTNYKSWRIYVTALLRERDCFGFVDETEPALKDDATYKEKKDYRLRKERALSTIILNVDPEVNQLLVDVKTAKDAWVILKSHFEPPSVSRLASLVDQLLALRFDPAEQKIGIFVSKIKNCILSIREAGLAFPELLAVFIIMRHLPPEYTSLVSNLHQRDRKDLTIANVEAALIAEESRILLKQDDEKIQHSLYAKSYRRGKGNRRTDADQRKTDNKRSDDKKTNEKKSDDKKPDQKSDFRPPVACFKCGKKGHYAANCRSKTTSSAVSSALIASALLTGDDSTDDWIIDSGATHHFANRKENFINYQPISGLVQVADRTNSVQVRGKGDIEMMVKSNNTEATLTLSNVLHIPDFRLSTRLKHSFIFR